MRIMLKGHDLIGTSINKGVSIFSSNVCRQLAYKSHGMIITFLISAPYFFLLIRSFKVGPRKSAFFKKTHGLRQAC